MKIHNKRELQEVAINHSADINYKYFLKIYINSTKQTYSFLTIGTTLSADNPFRFLKKYVRFFFIKMTLTEQVKILDDKVKANKAQYDLIKEAAKISALSSKELDKYEYLTSEDLGYKPDVILRAKVEYSPLAEAFNKVFKKDDKNKKTNMTMVWCMILCITLINIACLILMKYHQLTLNLIQKTNFTESSIVIEESRTKLAIFFLSVYKL